MGNLGANVNKAIAVVVTIIVLFLLYAAMIPEAQKAGDSLNASNRCTAEACYYNVSRAIDCTSHNVTLGDRSACARPTEIPLSDLFTGTGFVFILIMIALLLLIVKVIMPGKQK